MSAPTVPPAAETPARDERAPLLQWIGFGLPPAAFFAHLQLGYNLVPWSCAAGTRIWLHVVGLAAVLLAIAGDVISWRVWRRASDATGDEGGAPARTRLIGMTGLGVGMVLTLILLAQWVAGFVLSPCQ